MLNSRRDRQNLPWGWWLRATDSAFEDRDGRQWKSVRQAFWVGRLNFPSSRFAPEQLELLLRVLLHLDCEASSWTEAGCDLFAGDFVSWRFYCCWLASIGLTSTVDGTAPTEASLTEEGFSVLLMLQATRDPDWVDLPFSEIAELIQASTTVDAPEAMTAALNEFERSVSLRRNVFAREVINEDYLVTLTGFESTGRMPTRRIIWSASFTGAGPRDALFVWLAKHVHRWDDWATIAFECGAAALTQHMFTLFLAADSPTAA